MSFQEVFPIQFINQEHWLALLPLILMGFCAVWGLMVSPWQHGRVMAFSALCTGSVLALIALALGPTSGSISLLDGVLVVDRLSQIFSVVIIGNGLATALTMFGYDIREHIQSEIYSLIAFAVCGMLIMVGSRNLIGFFIGLELMSLAVYVMVGIRRQSPGAAEAALKYFLLGGVASAIWLYGASILYGTTGSLSFEGIGQTWQKLWGPQAPILPIMGLLLVGLGMLFKLGAVPFHVWIPDVYTGAATPVTGFMITGVKAAAIGAFLRISLEVFGLPELLPMHGSFYWLLWTITAMTLLYGAFVGLQQTNLKRLLAYSTIAHTGYVLLGFIALIMGKQPEAAEAIIAYTLFYAVMNLGGFAVLTLLSPEGSDEPSLKDLAGLGKSRPYVAFALTVFLLSMAGIPPTAGFFGKYYLFASALSMGELTLTVLAVIASVISVVFYLRPLVYMYTKPPETSEVIVQSWFGTKAVIGIALILTLGMCFLPTLFMGFLK